MTMPKGELHSVAEFSTRPNSLPHLSLNTTSAETKVREAAAAIGMDDEDRLSCILQRMKEEHVVYAWQLPALDSAEWKALGFSIGLTAAVRQLSLVRQVSNPSQPTSAHASPSPKSVDDSLLEIDDSDRVEDVVFEDQEELEESIFEEHEEEEMESLLNNLRRSRDTPSKSKDDLRSKSLDALINRHTDAPVEAEAECRGDKLAFRLFPTEKHNKENSGKLATSAINDAVKSLKPSSTSQNHSTSVGADRAALWRRSSLPLPKMLDLPDDIKRQGELSPVAPPYVANPESEARRFQEEWEEVEAVLGRLPTAEHRAILGQLIIVANGQTQAARVRLVENVIVRLRVIFSQRNSETKDLDLILDHIRHFARLRSEQRKLFGKFLFASLSQLHLSPAKSNTKETIAPQHVSV